MGWKIVSWESSAFTQHMYIWRESQRERGGKNDVIIRLVLEGIT